MTTSTSSPREEQFVRLGMSAKARGISEADLAGKPAEFAIPDVLVELAAAADVVLTYLSNTTRLRGAARFALVLSSRASRFGNSMRFVPMEPKPKLTRAQIADRLRRKIEALVLSGRPDTITPDVWRVPRRAAGSANWDVSFVGVAVEDRPAVEATGELLKRQVDME